MIGERSPGSQEQTPGSVRVGGRVALLAAFAILGRRKNPQKTKDFRAPVPQAASARSLDWEVAVLKRLQLVGLSVAQRALEDTTAHQKERDALFRFFRLNLTQRDVEYHWQRLLLHHSKFETQSGDKVDLRTAAFDYFLNETGLLAEPLVMERAELRRTELMAYFDKLTGLRNYAFFENEMHTEVARAQRYQTPLCLVLLDLDSFKEVNDHLGYLAGNQVLKRVGAILQKRLRASDLVARFGGTSSRSSCIRRISAMVNRWRAVFATVWIDTSSVLPLSTCPMGSLRASDSAPCLFRRRTRPRSSTWPIGPSTRPSGPGGIRWPASAEPVTSAKH